MKSLCIEDFRASFFFLNCLWLLLRNAFILCSSWPDGLLFNFSVATSPSSAPIDACDLWDQLSKSLQRTNGAIGGGALRVAPDYDLFNPCRPKVLPGEACGVNICNSELGEVINSNIFLWESITVFSVSPKCFVLGVNWFVHLLCWLNIKCCARDNL